MTPALSRRCSKPTELPSHEIRCENTKKNQKNQVPMKQIISLLLIISTISLFSQTGTKKITIDEIYKNRKFSSRGVSGLNSMKDGEHYCQLKKDSLNVYEYATGKLTQ